MDKAYIVLDRYNGVFIGIVFLERKSAEFWVANHSTGQHEDADYEIQEWSIED